jgi:hypothetical protein
MGDDRSETSDEKPVGQSVVDRIRAIPAAPAPQPAGRKKALRCEKGHAFVVDGRMLSLGDPIPGPCPRCAAGERSEKGGARSRGRAPARATGAPPASRADVAPIPSIEAESAEERAEKAAAAAREAEARAQAERQAAVDAALAQSKLAAELAAAKRKASDELRGALSALTRGRVSKAADAIAARRGKVAPSAMRMAVFRSQTQPTTDLANPKPPWESFETDVGTGLAIGVCDGLLEVLPDIPLFAMSWFPAALTCLTAALAMATTDAPDDPPPPRQPIQETPAPDRVTVRELAPDVPLPGSSEVIDGAR